MASSLGDLMVRVGIDTKNLKSGLADAVEALDKAGSRATAAGRAISKAFDNLGVGDAGSKLAAQAKALQSSFETIEGAFKKGRIGPDDYAKAIDALRGKLEALGKTKVELPDFSKLKGALDGIGLSKTDFQIGQEVERLKKHLHELKEEMDAGRLSAKDYAAAQDHVEQQLRELAGVKLPDLDKLDRTLKSLGLSKTEFQVNREIAQLRKELDYLETEYKEGRISAADFAKAQEQVNRSVAALKVDTSGIEKLQSTLSSVGSSLRDVGGMLTATVSLPIVALGAGAIKAAADFESLEIGLKAVTKEAGPLEAQLARLKEVAKLPGLGFKEAVQGSINLQAAGFSAQTAERALSAFGNALATVGKGRADLDGVILALTQIASKGKISAQEINQLAERLPQIRVAIKQAFGEGFNDAIDFEKAGIGAQQFIEKIIAEFEKLPKATGGFKNAMENLKDSADQALVSIGKALLPMATSALQALEPLVAFAEKAGAAFANLPEPLRLAAAAFAAFVAAAGPLLGGAGLLAGATNSILSLAANMKLAAAGAGPLAGVFNLLAGSLGIVVPLAIAFGVALAGWAVVKAVQNLSEVNAELDRWQSLQERGIKATSAQAREIQILEGAIAQYNREAAAAGKTPIVLPRNFTDLEDYIKKLRAAAGAINEFRMSSTLLETEKKTGKVNLVDVIGDLTGSDEALKKAEAVKRDIQAAEKEYREAADALEKLRKAGAPKSQLEEAKNRRDQAYRRAHPEVKVYAAAVDEAAKAEKRHADELERVLDKLRSSEFSEKLRKLGQDAEAVSEGFDKYTASASKIKVTLEDVSTAWQQYADEINRISRAQAAEEQKLLHDRVIAYGKAHEEIRKKALEPVKIELTDAQRFAAAGAESNAVDPLLGAGLALQNLDTLKKTAKAAKDYEAGLRAAGINLRDMRLDAAALENLWRQSVADIENATDESDRLRRTWVSLKLELTSLQKNLLNFRIVGDAEGVQQAQDRILEIENTLNQVLSLNDAFTKSGVAPLKALQLEVENTARAYELIADAVERGVAGQAVAYRAQLNLLEAMREQAIAAGRPWAELEQAIEEVTRRKEHFLSTKGLSEFEAAWRNFAKSVSESFGQSAADAVGVLVKGIADGMSGAKAQFSKIWQDIQSNFKQAAWNAFIGPIQQHVGELVETVTRRFITALETIADRTIGRIFDSLLSGLDRAIDRLVDRLVDRLTGTAMDRATDLAINNVPGIAQQGAKEITNPTFPGPPAGSSAPAGGGAAASAAAFAQSAANVANIANAFINAADAIIGFFQRSETNKTLDTIGKHTLQTANDLANLRQDEFQREARLLTKLDDINRQVVGTLREVRDAIKSSVSLNLTVGSTTEKAKTITDSIIAKLNYTDTTVGDRLLDLLGKADAIDLAVRQGADRIVAAVNDGVQALLGGLHAIEKRLGRGGGGIGDVFGIIPAISSGIADLGKGVAGIVSGVTKAVGNLGKGIVDGIKGAFGGGDDKGKMEVTLRKIEAEISSLRADSWAREDHLLQKLDDLWRTLLDIFDLIGTRLVDAVGAIPAAFEGLLDTLSAAVDRLSGLSPETGEQKVESVDQLAQVVSQSFSDLGNQIAINLAEQAMMLRDTSNENTGTITTALETQTTRIVEAVQSGNDGLSTSLRSVFGVNPFAGFVATQPAMGPELPEGFEAEPADGIVDANIFVTIVRTLETGFANVVNAVTGLGEKLGMGGGGEPVSAADRNTGTVGQKIDQLREYWAELLKKSAFLLETLPPDLRRQLEAGTLGNLEGIDDSTRDAILEYKRLQAEIVSVRDAVIALGRGQTQAAAAAAPETGTGVIRSGQDATAVLKTRLAEIEARVQELLGTSTKQLDTVFAKLGQIIGRGSTNLLERVSEVLGPRLRAMGGLLSQDVEDVLRVISSKLESIVGVSSGAAADFDRVAAELAEKLRSSFAGLGDAVNFDDLARVILSKLEEIAGSAKSAVAEIDFSEVAAALEQEIRAELGGIADTVDVGELSRRISSQLSDFFAEVGSDTENSIDRLTEAIEDQLRGAFADFAELSTEDLRRVAEKLASIVSSRLEQASDITADAYDQLTDDVAAEVRALLEEAANIRRQLSSGVNAAGVDPAGVGAAAGAANFELRRTIDEGQVGIIHALNSLHQMIAANWSRLFDVLASGVAVGGAGAGAGAGTGAEAGASSGSAGSASGSSGGSISTSDPYRDPVTGRDARSIRPGDPGYFVDDPDGRWNTGTGPMTPIERANWQTRVREAEEASRRRREEEERKREEERAKVPAQWDEYNRTVNELGPEFESWLKMLGRAAGQGLIGARGEGAIAPPPDISSYAARWRQMQAARERNQQEYEAERAEAEARSRAEWDRYYQTLGSRGKETLKPGGSFTFEQWVEGKRANSLMASAGGGLAPPPFDIDKLWAEWQAAQERNAEAERKYQERTRAEYERDRVAYEAKRAADIARRPWLAAGDNYERSGIGGIVPNLDNYLNGTSQSKLGGMVLDQNTGLWMSEEEQKMYFKWLPPVKPQAPPTWEEQWAGMSASQRLTFLRDSDLLKGKTDHWYDPYFAGPELWNRIAAQNNWDPGWAEGTWWMAPSPGLAAGSVTGSAPGVLYTGAAQGPVYNNNINITVQGDMTQSVADRLTADLERMGVFA